MHSCKSTMPKPIWKPYVMLFWADSQCNIFEQTRSKSQHLLVSSDDLPAHKDNPPRVLIFFSKIINDVSIYHGEIRCYDQSWAETVKK